MLDRPRPGYKTEQSDCWTLMSVQPQATCVPSVTIFLISCRVTRALVPGHAGACGRARRAFVPCYASAGFPFATEFTYADLNPPQRSWCGAGSVLALHRESAPVSLRTQPVAEGVTVGSARPGARPRLDRGHARRRALAGLSRPALVDPRHTRFRPALPVRVAADRPGQP